MPRSTRGSIYRVKDGFGIRWQYQGERGHKSGFRTKTDARDWFGENIKPRLRRGIVSSDVTFAEFVPIYLERWSPGKSPRTVKTIGEWFAPALDRFGAFTLHELEGAASDIARWRAGLSSENQRYVATRALRQVLGAAVRWDYMSRNPALAAGKNEQPRSEEIRPFTGDELGRIVQELAPRDAAIVVFVAETGLRTTEWIPLERRDVDWRNPAVTVRYRKTDRSVRRVPLTPRAQEALGWLPARLDSQLLFSSAEGHRLSLNNWSGRVWRPALQAAGVDVRGVYHLRHSFATNALRAGVSVRSLARLMGTSVLMVERHYAGWAQDDEDYARQLLTGRVRDESEAGG